MFKKWLFWGIEKDVKMSLVKIALELENYKNISLNSIISFNMLIEYEKVRVTELNDVEKLLSILKSLKPIRDFPTSKYNELCIEDLNRISNAYLEEIGVEKNPSGDAIKLLMKELENHYSEMSSKVQENLQPLIKSLETIKKILMLMQLQME